MIADEEFYSKCEEDMKELKAPMVISLNHHLQGYFVQINESCAIVDEEFDFVTRLPKYLKNRKDTESYIKNMDVAFNNGKLRGKKELQRDLRVLLAVPSESYVDHIDSRTCNRLNKIEES